VVNDQTVCQNLEVEEAFQKAHHPQSFEEALAMVLKPDNISIQISHFLTHKL